MINTEKLLKSVLNALEDMKAQDVITLDVAKFTAITDVIVICSGTSSRHVNSIADRVIEYASKLDAKPLGIEGKQQGKWVLVDLNAIIIHIMMPEIRKFYQLEKLWDLDHHKSHKNEI